MWRKIRRFYWYRRDRGLGKQTIAMAVMLLLLVIILAGAIAKSIVPQKDLRNEAEIPANTATGPAISTSPATGAAVLEEETGSKEVPSDNNKALDVDTTGLSSFVGWECISVRLQSEELCGRIFADKLYGGRYSADERTTITSRAGNVEKAATGRKEKTAKTKESI